MMTLGLSPALGQAPSSGAAVINPNLLTWTEHFENAAWVKSGGAAVTADQGTDPLGGNTADLVDLSAGVGAFISQVTSVSCTTASGSTNVNLTGVSARYQGAATVDGAAYTLSLWMADAAAHQVQLRVDASGGRVRVSVRDIGDGATPLCWGAKLEIGSQATGDATSYGARTT